MKIGCLTLRAGFILLLSFLTFFDEGMLLWVVWAAALLHETGHYIVLRLAGGRVDSLELHGGGVTMHQASVPGLSYRREFLAVAAGPAASLICALLFSRLDGMIEEAMALSGMCLSHGVFNLLPAQGLDGGRMLSLGLSMGGHPHPYPVLRITSILSVLLIAASGLWFFVVTGGDAAVPAACALAIAALLREMKA